MVQIIGTKKCPETRKALRFCKERSITCQFLDVSERELSPGEWAHVFQALPAESLINRESSFYKKEGYGWREYDPQDELQNHIELLKTPLVRVGHVVTCGFDPQQLLASGVCL